MGHTPFGYRIENGKAVIDEAAAAQVRDLHKNYLSGLSLTNAAKEAGLDLLHAGAKRMMLNRHYLGDDFYPAIIGIRHPSMPSVRSLPNAPQSSDGTTAILHQS